MDAARTTDWVLMSIPGRDDEEGNELEATTWHAYNRETARCVSFDSRQEANAFVNHPDNRKE